MNSSIDYSTLSDEELLNTYKKQSESRKPKQEDYSSFSDEDLLKEYEKSQASSPTQETGLESLVRHGARTASRVGETILGLPGDVKSLTDEFIYYVTEKAGLDSSGVRKAREEVPDLFPTSSKLKRFSEEVTGGYTAPRTPGEEISDEVVSDIASLAIPIKGKMPGAKSISRAIGISVGSNAVKQGVLKATDDEVSSSAAKIGTMFLLGMASPNGVKKFINDKYSSAYAAIPSGERAAVPELSNRLNSIIKKAERGVGDPTSEEVVKRAKTLLGKVKNGKIDPQELITANQNLNNLTGIPSNLKGQGNQLFDIKSAVQESLNEYGKKNPSFLKQFRDANEGYAALAQSKKASNYITNLYKNNKSLAAPLAYPLFHYGIVTPAAKATVVGAGALKTGELLHRVYKSPVLRGYYLDVVENASRESSAATIKSLEKLNDELKKN